MSARLLLCIVFALLTANTSAQWQLTHSIPLKQASKIWADATGNAYILQQNELIMLNRKDSLAYKYSDYRLGPISQVDISNPLKIMVYHEQQSIILFLDNTLSRFSPPIYIQDLNLQQVPVVCNSYNNGFWIFEPETMAIIRYDRQLDQVVSLPNVHIMAGLPEIRPLQMLEAGNRLYILASGYGLIIFDVFGAFIQKLYIPEALSMQVIDQQIVLFTGHSFLLFTHQLEKALELPIPEEAQQPNMAYGTHKIWAITPNQLQIWSTNK